VHRGHVAFALEAIEQCGLDKVFFLVEPRPRRKQGVKALEHRAEMVRLAIRQVPSLGSILLQQQRFTVVHTLPVLQRRFKGAQLHMLMGDDWLVHFADWPHVEELLRDISFVIGIRQYSGAEVEARIQFIQKARGLTMRYQLFQPSGPEVSSSKVRRQVRAGEESEDLSPAVLDYIRAQGLYSTYSSAVGSSIKS